MTMMGLSDRDRKLFERNVAAASLHGEKGAAALATAVMALADAIRDTAPQKGRRHDGA